jgi:exodeoxyribonuclease V gamma subunit
LVESVFAGDPAHGLPAIPVQVADRSMRADNPLLDAVGALLALLDGRFRAGDVLAFAARPPVSRALGLSAVHLDRMTEWAEGTHVRWGLDAASHRQFGVPADLAAHTWQAGLDQLLVGATMAGPAFGPGRTVPWPDIEGDDVEILGAVAELIARLRVAYRSLGRPMPPGEFLGALAEAASSLFAVSDADSWQWRDLTRLLDELRLDTEIGAASPQPVATDEMVALVSQRLVGRPGRPRFDSGAVTLSSLTAQRGVPRPVICLVGLDGDVGSAAALAADDLTTQPACVGDRDTRSELRAQLLDALLAAGERVVICANGHDLRTNADVPPSVPVAELCDLLDASAVPSGARRVSEQVSTAHPRQAWSTENFVPGALGVPGAWSFDRVGHDAASARRSQVPRGPLLVTPLVPDHVPTVTIADLVGTLRNPVETLLRQRLGLWIDREGEVAIDHLVPLGADALHRWGLANDLLARRMSAPPAHGPTLVDEWAEVQRRRGAVPPLGFGDGALDGATAQVDALLDALTRSLAGVLEGAPPVLGARTVELGLDGVLPGAAGSSRSITGEIGGIVGHVVVEVTPSRLKPSNRLIAWLHLACLTRQHPEVDWEAVVIGRASNDKVVTERVRLRSAHAAGTALAALVELHDQARCQLIPALPKTAEALARGDLDAAFDAWDPTAMFAAEGADRWVRFALGASDLHDLLDPESPLHCPHLVPWATRLWTAYRETTFEGDEWDRD